MWSYLTLQLFIQSFTNNLWKKMAIIGWAIWPNFDIQLIKLPLITFIYRPEAFWWAVKSNFGPAYAKDATMYILLNKLVFISQARPKGCSADSHFQISIWKTKSEQTFVCLFVQCAIRNYQHNRDSILSSGFWENGYKLQILKPSNNVLQSKGTY